MKVKDCIEVSMFSKDGLPVMMVTKVTSSTDFHPVIKKQYDLLDRGQNMTIKIESETPEGIILNEVRITKLICTSKLNQN